MVDCIFANKEVLNCCCAAFLRSIVQGVLGIDIVDNKKEFVCYFDIKRQRGFAISLDIETVFFIDNLLAWTFFGNIEFKNRLKAEGNLDVLKSWLGSELSKLRNRSKGNAISDS